MATRNFGHRVLAIEIIKVAIMMIEKKNFFCVENAEQRGQLFSSILPCCTGIERKNLSNIFHIIPDLTVSFDQNFNFT